MTTFNRTDKVVIIVSIELHIIAVVKFCLNAMFVPADKKRIFLVSKSLQLD